LSVNNTTHNNRSGYLALATTSLLWGTTWVVSKFAVQSIPGLQLAYIRQLMAGSLFVLFFLLVKKHSIPSKRDFRFMFVLSLLMMVMANGLSTWGIKHLPTGLASLIGAMYPLSVVFIEWIFYGKRNVSLLTFVGFFLGLAGIGFVFYSEMFSVWNASLIFGLMLSVVAMLSWSLGTVFLSRHVLETDPYHAMGWQMLMGSVMLYALSKWTHQSIPLDHVDPSAWVSILYLALIGSVLCFIAFIYSLKTLPASIASLYAYINPIVAMALASIWLKEQMSFSTLIGSLVTLLGVYLVNHSIKRDQLKLPVESEI
jgi:drug/metabolite transporter (DMT)-like permease